MNKLCQHFAERTSEWVNAFTLILWGGYVAAHPQALSYPAFQGLDYILGIGQVPLALWGLIAFVVGWVRATALLVNGAYSRTPIVRLVTSAFSASIWCQICVGYLNGGQANPAIVLYMAAVVMDLISAYRAAYDVAMVEGVRHGMGQGPIENGQSDSGRSARSISHRDERDGADTLHRGGDSGRGARAEGTARTAEAAAR